MIVLGSQSPRRKKLMMSDITDDFIVDVSNIDEKTSLCYKPVKAVTEIAKRKGDDVSSRHPNDVVICADTIVVFKGNILVKPKDKNDAFIMLKELSNRTHKVITAYYIKSKNEIIVKHVSSFVKFNKLSDELIQKYIDSGLPMDKAGAYGIQDEGFDLVKSVRGSWKNVVGFPTDEIIDDLKRLKVKF